MASDYFDPNMDSIFWPQYWIWLSISIIRFHIEIWLFRTIIIFEGVGGDALYLDFFVISSKKFEIGQKLRFFRDGCFWPFFGISDYTGKNVKNTIWKSIKSCILWKHSQAKISKYHTKMLKNQKNNLRFFWWMHSPCKIRILLHF